MRSESVLTWRERAASNLLTVRSTPMATMIDDTLISLAMVRRATHVFEPGDFRHIARVFDIPAADLIDDIVDDRELSILHQVLLGIHQTLGSLETFLAGYGPSPSPSPAGSIDIPDARGRAPLAWAVEYGWEDAVRTLLRHGADPRRAGPSLRGYQPLLHLAIAGPVSDRSNDAILGVVRLLLEAGADANGPDHEGWTPLHVAASWNNLEVIRELARFAGPALGWDSVTDDGQSAAALAPEDGYDEEVQLLLRSRGLGEAPGSPASTGYACSESSDYFDCVEQQGTDDASQATTFQSDPRETYTGSGTPVPAASGRRDC